MSEEKSEKLENSKPVRKFEQDLPKQVFKLTCSKCDARFASTNPDATVCHHCE